LKVPSGGCFEGTFFLKIFDLIEKLKAIKKYNLTGV
jgi:hypothetical protein